MVSAAGWWPCCRHIGAVPRQSDSQTQRSVVSLPYLPATLADLTEMATLQRVQKGRAASQRHHEGRRRGHRGRGWWPRQGRTGAQEKIPWRRRKQRR